MEDRMNRDPGAWRDVSSFARNDTERIPNAFELQAADVRITVHRWLNLPDVWHVSVRWHGSFIIDRHPLAAKDIEDAKHEAVCRALQVFQTSTAALEQQRPVDPR